jgi:hypothetical protein
MYFSTNFQLGYFKVFPSHSLIPLKKGTLWQVTKDTFKIENEELFNSAKLRSKIMNPHFRIKKINIMHLQKRN